MHIILLYPYWESIFGADPAFWIKTFVSIHEMCQVIFLILTQLWSSKIVFQFCQVSYRALTWPCGDRRALLTEKILLMFQSGSKEESLLLLTLLPRSAGCPKGFVLYLEGNQTRTELENYFLWNLTHQICQIMFFEVNLGGQHQHKSSIIAYTGAHRRGQQMPRALCVGQAQCSDLTTSNHRALLQEGCCGGETWGSLVVHIKLSLLMNKLKWAFIGEFQKIQVGNCKC